MRDLTDLALRPCSPGVEEEVVAGASPSAEDCETVDAVECLRVNFARSLVFRSPMAIEALNPVAVAVALTSTGTTMQPAKVDAGASWTGVLNEKRELHRRRGGEGGRERRVYQSVSQSASE